MGICPSAGPVGVGIAEEIVLVVVFVDCVVGTFNDTEELVALVV
jgi:hypothetical protein